MIKSDKVRIPRGIRNNNPGNIRRTPIDWRGEVTRTDTEFEEFEDMAHGYRALMMNIRTYMRRDHLRTVRQIITKWAPPAENDTAAYISQVCKRTGFLPNQILMINKETLTAIAAAISYVENGIPAVMADIEEGWRLL